MINFIDIGAHHGNVIDVMVKLFDTLNVEYKVYAFEPDPEDFAVLSSKYWDKHVLINKACTNHDGFENLYKSKQPGGHSLHVTKHNVNPNKFLKVEVLQFSKWFMTNIDPNDFNIVKINTEGSEYEIFEDIMASGINKDINVFCGSLGDIYKVGKKPSEIQAFLKQLEDNNINVIVMSAKKQQNIPRITEAILKWQDEKPVIPWFEDKKEEAIIENVPKEEENPVVKEVKKEIPQKRGRGRPKKK